MGFHPSPVLLPESEGGDGRAADLVGAGSAPEEELFLRIMQGTPGDKEGRIAVDAFIDQIEPFRSWAEARAIAEIDAADADRAGAGLGRVSQPLVRRKIPPIMRVSMTTRKAIPAMATSTNRVTPPKRTNPVIVLPRFYRTLTVVGEFWPGCKFLLC